MSDAESVASRLARGVLEAIEAGRLPLRGRKVVVAVSGGADSLCLLYLLHSLTSTLGCTLHVAHLDHMLRGDEAEEDARFVLSRCEMLGLQCTTGRRDVATCARSSTMSLEEAARVARYGFLAEVARAVDATLVATGHTADDLAETVLLHVLRGTGVHGLRGLDMVAPLPCQSPSEGESLLVVRPLLGATHEETEEYCRGIGAVPRFDSSNASSRFLRNRVRSELLPLARELNPRVDDALVRLAGAASEDDQFISEMARMLWRRIATASQYTVRIDAEAFRTAAPALQQRLVSKAMWHLVGDARDLTFQHVRSVRDLAAGVSGGRVETVGALVWRKTGDDLVVSSSCLTTREKRAELPDEGVVLKVPGQTVLPGWIATAALEDVGDCADPGRFVACLDAGLVGAPLLVRRRRPGDRFQPLGMGVEKKLQDFMVDEKVPAEIRDNVPLVCAGERIVWVVGWRVAEWTRVGPDTKQVLRLDFLPKP